MTDLAERLASLDDCEFFRLMHSLATAVESLHRAGLTTLEMGEFVMAALAAVGRR